MSKEYWNDIYSNMIIDQPNIDEWLGRYDELLKDSISCPIIDLGCGFGNDTLYLINKGYSVISCDFSEEVLLKLKALDERVNSMCFDINGDLPFKSNNTKIIIADLSLHYFSWNDTKNIVEEISRVLDKDGILLCRVNSVNDFNYGAGIGEEIERNYYLNDGRYKRFFDEEQLKELFESWHIMSLEEKEFTRYRYSKVAWEVIIRNK